MKLLKRDESSFIFLIGKRERQMMFTVLKQYPSLSSAEARVSRGQPDEADAEREQLLREALAEHKKENKKLLDDLLSAKGRFTEDQLGYRFSLTSSELEWLLQVFNDVRVGSWVRLGSPKVAGSVPVPLNEESVKLCWAMEIAGLFESELLQALSSSE